MSFYEDIRHSLLQIIAMERKQNGKLQDYLNEQLKDDEFREEYKEIIKEVENSSQ